MAILGNLNFLIRPTAEEVVEEVKELTLDEYRALRGKRQQPQFNLRRAGEGEDLTQWNNLVEIKKKKDGEAEDEEVNILNPNYFDQFHSIFALCSKHPFLVLYFLLIVQYGIFLNLNNFAILEN